MAEIAIEMHVPNKGGAGVLTRIERALPPPGPGEMRIAVEAAGVAFADIVVRRGLYTGHKPPVTPGYDVVGRVEAVGPDVTSFRPGQRVAGVTISGSYATRRNVEARWMVPAPEEADPVKLVAAVLNGLTAWQMLHRVARSEAGDWVLVHGAAVGVGGLLVDLARLVGMRPIGTASASKQKAVEAAGAVAVDYGAGDVVKKVRDISGGGVLAGFDHIGGRHFRAVTMAALAPTGIGVLYGGYNATRDGRVSLLAVADMMLNARLSAMKLFGSGQAVAGYAIPVWRNQRPEAYRADLAHVLGLVASGALSPAIAEILPLTMAGRAHELLEARRVVGKIVLVPDPA